jgi:ABC-type phosphate transport system substrate-binding protein
VADFRRVFAVAAAVAVAAAMAAVPALADPPGRAAPQNSIVGVGSDTTQNVFDQFSVDYNTTSAVKAGQADRLFSWDATGPTAAGLPPADAGDIVTKGPVSATSPCLVLRPNGSEAGVAALAANTADASSNTGFCTDFARSSSGPSPTTPPGLQYVPLARDNVTWAVNKVTNAPANLTTSDLLKIYTCAVTNWDQVGGGNAKIDAQLPQTSSGTRRFFLTAINGGTIPATPGKCVDDSKGESATTPPPAGNLPEENEGYDQFLQGPDVIFPFSAAQWIADGNSASCTVKNCARIDPAAGVPGCHTPAGKQLKFGCDYRVNMVLGDINGTSPLTSSGAQNTKFTPLFTRTVFAVVRQAPGEPGNVPAYLQPLFGPAGWVFGKTALADLCAYGFETAVAQAKCGGGPPPPPALEIDNKADNKPVPKDMQVWIGQAISLTGKLGNGAAVTWSWSMTPAFGRDTTVTAYGLSAGARKVDEPDYLTISQLEGAADQSISFHFIKPGPYTITLEAKDPLTGAVIATATATFKVGGPEPAVTGTPGKLLICTWKNGDDKKYQLAFQGPPAGCIDSPEGASTTPGFAYEATVPAANGRAMPAESKFAVTQLITDAITTKGSKKDYTCNLKRPGADGHAFYDGQVTSAKDRIKFDDSPDLGLIKKLPVLGDITAVTRAFGATDYLMYNPDPGAAGNIWVPVATGEWGFSGTAKPVNADPPWKVTESTDKKWTVTPTSFPEFDQVYQVTSSSRPPFHCG